MNSASENNDYNEGDINKIWEEYKELRKKNSPRDPKIKEYERTMLWNLTENALKKSADNVFKEEQPDGVILTVGFSVEPIAGTLSALNPKYACLIHTAETEDKISEILELSKYSINNIKKFLVKKDNPLSLYQKYKDAVYHLRVDRKIGNIAIDPTGGTKIMPYIGGLISINYNISLIYVSNHEYDNDIRRPKSGSEYFIYNKNMADSFPDSYFFNALNLMETYNFSSAFKLWNDKYNKFKQTHNILYFILNGLKSWDSFNYNGAKNNIKQALSIIKELVSERDNLDTEIINVLSKWVKHIDNILDKNRKYNLAIDYYCYSLRRKESDDNNISTIIAYLAIEIIIDNLWDNCGLDRVNFNLSDFDEEQHKLVEEAYKRNKKEIPKNGSKLGLIDGLIVMSSFYDRITMKYTGAFRKYSSLRNDIVHRGRNIDEEELKKFLSLIHDFILMLYDSKIIDLKILGNVDDTSVNFDLKEILDNNIISKSDLHIIRNFLVNIY